MIQWIDEKRNKKGFTLIELVVVITILGILGAIAVPRFSTLLITSQIKADAATAQEIITAARIKEAETGKRLDYSGEDKKGIKAEDHLEGYMVVPDPKSAKPGGKADFLLSGGDKLDWDGSHPYVVYWYAFIYGEQKIQKVREGEPFVITTEDDPKADLDKVENK